MRPPRCLLSLAWLVAAAEILLAQQGDRPGEMQAPLPPDVVVPDASPRSAADEAGTFRLAPGFRLELFAAEPMVADPVAAAFDPAGRLWVVEMRGYMNDLSARDERAPVGRIVVLRDTDGDGRPDASSVFADGLVLPRAVLPLRGGALVVAPPELVWLGDADGDLRADSRTVVMGGFEAGLENPEHSGNGLLWSFDQRIHLANDSRLVRYTPAGFVVEAGAGGGQWGITHDDRGRLYFNYNEDWLRCDLVPGRYGPRAMAAGGLPQLNRQLCPERTVWPIRRTPGVNRGYQPGRLVDWVLAIHTAVCSPHVYRGGLLDAAGDVFVCEPAGNLVRRFRLADADGAMRGVNPYEAQRAEFLASTDERFRPVSLLTGLDGSLLVVDMYRGVIQHKNFVTTFLKQQIQSRGLERPIGLGRIWRVLPAHGEAPRPVTLPSATPARLLAALDDANGAVRDLAMRELVQTAPRSELARLAASWQQSARPGSRLAAFGVLAGVGAVGATEVRAALRDRDPGVIAFALGQAAPAAAAGDAHVWLAFERLVAHDAASVRWHLALAMADVAAAPGASRWRSRRLALLGALLARDGADSMARGAIAVGAGDDLAALTEQVLAASEPTAAWLPAAVRDFGVRALKSKRPALQSAWFDLASSMPAGPMQLAAVRGAVDALPKGQARQGWLTLPAPSRALLGLAAAGDRAVPALAQELIAAVTIVGGAAAASVATLTAAEQQRVRIGEGVFARSCASCHQLDGSGMQGMAPPLRDSEWALGPVDRLVRIVAHGLRGPVDVGGATWSLEMPAQKQLSDDEVAAALSYVRRAFGHAATAVAPDEVHAVRTEHARRGEPWTAAELLGQPAGR